MSLLPPIEMEMNPIAYGHWTTGTYNMARSFEAAAQEIAEHPYEDDEGICRKWGIFLDELTDDERYYLSRLVEDFAHACK